jgi:rsbT co-antagonist protein RsbR
MALDQPNSSEESYLLMIEQQRKTIASLEIPVLQIWDGILALPLLGTLDPFRAQRLTEVLLQRIVETGSEVAVVDLSGIASVEASVARHIIETVSAARLLGAEVIIVGLSTRAALTLVHLGVDLANITTRSSLPKGLDAAFDRLGLQVTARPAVADSSPRSVDRE